MRRKETVTIEGSVAGGPLSRPNRDVGKQFIITEMSAAKAEKWALKLLLCLGHANIDVPPEAIKSGFVGVALYALNMVGNVRYEEAEPLLNEMFECVTVPTIVKDNPERRPTEDDIEEVSTRVFLRQKIFEMHLDFLKAVVPSIFQQGGDTSKTTAPVSANT